MRGYLGCCLALIIAAPALAQTPKADETPTFSLKVRPVGAPVPSFRFELLPPLRERIPGNAALLHHRALHILSDARPAAKEHSEKQERFLAALEEPIAKFPKTEAKEYLRTYASVFREMEAAVKCERCDWGIDQRVVTDGIGVLLPDAQKLRELAFLLRLRCHMYTAEGKYELALKDIQTGFALAQHAAQGPTLIQFLIGNAIAAMFIHELEQTIQSPNCPNLYWSLTALPRPLIGLRSAMEGEMRMQEAMIPLPKGVDKGPMTSEEALSVLDRVWEGMSKLADEPDKLTPAQARIPLAMYITLTLPSARKSLLAAGKTEAELEVMPPAQIVMLDSLVRFRNLRDEHFVWFNAPYTEAVEGIRRSEEKMREASKGPAIDVLQKMLLLLLPAVEKVYGAQIRTERRLASLRAVEAVRLYASKNDGSLPTKLSDVTMVPVPVDPATNQPFAYGVEGNTFTLSVPPPPGNKPDRGNHWKYVVTIGK